MNRSFLCQFPPCCYQSFSYKRFLRHTWDKHSLEIGFKYCCSISSCPKTYSNAQSFRRHLKSAHRWFYDKHFSDNREEGDNDETADCYDSNEINSDIEIDNDVDVDPAYEETITTTDYDDLVASFLLELRHCFGVTTEGTCFISETIRNILRIERDNLNSFLKNSLQKHHGITDLHYEAKTILGAESGFSLSFGKFVGPKNLTKYIKSKNSYIDPKEICIGFDESKGKNDTVQYVPILETLKLLLSHEDVLGKVKSHDNVHNKLNNFSDGNAAKQNKLFSVNSEAVQIVLYRDDFGIVNALGNKVSKYKLSGFYFVIGNLPLKYKCRLKDIHLVLLSPAEFVKKYGYKSLLQPVLEDLRNLEIHGIKVTLDRKVHIMLGTISMIITDNLAAHALGGFFCNFSTVQQFCRFCMAKRDSLNDITKNSQLRSKESYDFHIRAIEIDASMCSVYGLQSESCFNALEYYHVADGLPPDIAHDIFEGFARDLTRNILCYIFS